MKQPKNIIKYIIGFLVCLLIRLIPFRPPNVEPVTATILPFGKKWGWIAAAIFGAASIVLFDLITLKIGIWTLVTAFMFALIGAASGLYLKKRENKARHYVGFAIIATLIYDFITGPIMSSMIWKMPFMQALFGQIPFTINHLAGNIVLSALLSPILYKWVIDNKHLELNKLVQRFAAKT